MEKNEGRALASLMLTPVGGILGELMEEYDLTPELLYVLAGGKGMIIDPKHTGQKPTGVIFGGIEDLRQAAKKLHQIDAPRRGGKASGKTTRVERKERDRLWVEEAARLRQLGLSENNICSRLAKDSGRSVSTVRRAISKK